MAGCSTVGTGQTKTGGNISLAGGARQAQAAPDAALAGNSEQEAGALLKGCLWRISERDGKVLPATMDYREERRKLGLQNGKVIWVRRG